MNKIRRIIADIIDYLIIMILMDLFFDKIYHSFDLGSVKNNILIVIFIISTLILIIFRDCTFQNNSLGKCIMKIRMINSYTNKKIINIESVKRNIINLVTLPLSFVTLVALNKTIGDFICKVIFIYDKNTNCINIETFLSEKRIKLSLYGKILITMLITILIYSLVIYLLFQKINYYSLRIMLILIVSLLLLFSYILVLYKYDNKIKIIAMIPFFVFLIISYDTNFEQNFIKNINISNYLEYMYPKNRIIHKKCVIDGCFVFFKDIYDDKNDLVFLKEKGNILNFIENQDKNKKYIKNFTKITTGSVRADIIINYKFYVSISNSNLMMIIIDTNENNNIVTDEKFKKFNFIIYNKRKYYYMLVDKLDKDYSVIIDGHKYKIYKKNN